jgi:inosine-uridine nucleoside N-ribohydrolase
MYDLAPILWSMDPSFYPTEPRSLRVETRDEPTTGMTLSAPGAPNADVSVAIRAEAVREIYLKTILGEQA